MKEVESLKDKNIKEVKKELGYWWVLENCIMNVFRNHYTFHRAPNKYLHIITDMNNIVISAMSN